LYQHEAHTGRMRPEPLELALLGSSGDQ
jgi:hypothetical protein